MAAKNRRRHRFPLTKSAPKLGEAGCQLARQLPEGERPFAPVYGGRPVGDDLSERPDSK